MRMNEAKINDTDTGRTVEGEGWFVLNIADVSWERLPQQGIWCNFEDPDARSAQFGIGVHVLTPGQANGLYHAESDQEGFLVLAGELHRGRRGHRAAHAAVGLPALPARYGAHHRRRRRRALRDPHGRRTNPGKTIHYPVEPLAARYGASVAQATDSPREAYADFDGTVTRERAPWP
jgi:uncharacterized cupin superfamily protein